MKLIIIVLSLLSERYLIHSISFQRFSWFPEYVRWIKHFQEKCSAPHNGFLNVGFVMLPILLVVMVVYGLLHHQLFGLVGLVLNLFIFYYCLGPKNLFYPNKEDYPEPGSYLVKVNELVFGVVFWYMILGVFGALTYRLVHLCKSHEETEPSATMIAEILDWIPTRLTALMYMLVGNFQLSLKRYVQYFLKGPSENKNLLMSCGLLALKPYEDDAALPESETLVEHATLIYLALIELFTLGSWL
jgi:AmpE protein